MKRKFLDPDINSGSKRRAENETFDFSRFYDSKTKSFSLAKRNMNDADIAFIASWLAQHPDTATLNLNNNLISDVGAKKLALILQKYPAIKILNLRSNKIGNVGVNALIEILNTIKDRSIQLDLTWNQEISQKGTTQLKLYSMREGSSHHHHVLFHDFVQPAIVSDIPKLEDLAIKTLIKHGSLFKDDDKISDTTASQPKRIASVLEQNIPKLIPEFLQAVVDEDEETVIKLLNIFPELLFCEPPKELVIESKLTWQKFYAEKALTMAAKRKQFKMFELLFSYFNKLLQHDEAAKAMNAAVCTAQAEGISAWKCYATQNTEIIIPEEYTRYFESLINIISRETFPNGAAEDSRLSEETEFALATLLNMLIPKKGVNLDDYLDVELFLLAAYKVYWNDRELDRIEKMNAYCRRVIGLIQSVLSPEAARIFCTGLDDIVTAMKAAIKQGNNITGCMPFSVLAKQHKWVNATDFYRVSRDSQRGLGFEVFGVRNGKWSMTSVLLHDADVDAWKYYVEQKQQVFLENYAAIAVAAKPVPMSCKS